MWNNAYVGDVMHNSSPAAGERGTGAAVVTRLEVRVTIVPPPVIADRPFQGASHDDPTTAVPFPGRIVGPS